MLKEVFDRGNQAGGAPTGPGGVRNVRPNGQIPGPRRTASSAVRRR
jgi:hypothetical protein